ncbi:PREDICTED: uncharacterized protein LOC108562532 isoform X2 [Nicrophorus vespilloides]|uniref:Uncharacterized protein LOC108562532 isoform X2 n=1 Tax=Nicrophorus vespilloides TaxID=110193 RepID=A0ABM1MP94_NICVS|nr:PREDICTED: uncharacterized protein LOC108562532 isoform X2 [Nicrophorus vespilloides]
MNKLVLVCFVVVAVAAMLQESEAFAVESNLQKEPKVETTIDGKVVKRSAQNAPADAARETARVAAEAAKATARQAAKDADNVAKQAAKSARETASRT